MRLLILLLISTQVFSQQQSDSSTIVGLLIKDYKTMGDWDIKSHIANCTDNYMLLENGEIWDMEKEREYYLKNASRVIDRKDYFDIKYIRIYGDIAYAVYNLRSDITEKGNLSVKNWLETAIFRKINGDWKIELINSTPITAKK